MSIDKKALVIVLAVFFGLSIFRAYHLYLTSFFVSDEYRYTRDALSGTGVDYTVATRFVFTAMNSFLFNILQIRNLDTFTIFLPFYLFTWISISVYFFYRLMKLLEFGPTTIALSLASSLVLVSFTLLSLGFLSEPFGLAMATVGIYCLVWYIKKGGKDVKSIMSLFASVLAFALASFSREPYYLFLVGGIIISIVSVISKNDMVRRQQPPKILKTWTFLPIVMFFGLGLYFLNILETHSLSLGGQSLRVVYVLVGGLSLGWGPILVAFTVTGFLILIRNRKLSLLLVCLIALGSYGFVAYLTVVGLPPPTPTTPLFYADYLSFEHFSTIIRFTDTAIPSFFLAAPFAFAFVAKRKKLVYLTLVLFLVFGLGAIGAYQSYASSNLGLRDNPFSLDYRSGGAMVRDYIVEHPSAAPFHIVGFWTATWYETTGTSQVDPKTFDFWMNMSKEQFIEQHWTTFYVYGYNLRYPNQTAHSLDYGTSSEYLATVIYYPYPPTYFRSVPLSPYALIYVQSHPPLPQYPFKVISRTMLANATAFLIKFDVVWK